MFPHWPWPSAWQRWGYVYIPMTLQQMWGSLCLDCSSMTSRFGLCHLAELLTQMSRAILSEMVSIIFARLPTLQEPPSSASPDPQLDAHKIHSVSHVNLPSLETDHTMSSENMLDDAEQPLGSLNRSDPAYSGASSESTEDVQDMAYPKPDHTATAPECRCRAGSEPTSPVPTGAGPGTLVTVIDDSDTTGMCPSSNNTTPISSPRGTQTAC